MMYLHKILPLVISPLFFIILIIILGILLKSKKISFLGIFILILCSLPIFSNKLIHYLEKNFQPTDISNIKNVDAIVVLSGMIRVVKNDKNYKYEFTDAVDRILAGIDLIKINKAPYIILTRGSLPGSPIKSEGEVLYDHLIKAGINKEKIILTAKVQNTDQEAKSIKKLLNNKIKEIILVTSAIHMPRAIKVFEAVEINVVPFPVDFSNYSLKFTFMDFIPSASAFNKTSYFVREMQGRIYYKLKY